MASSVIDGPYCKIRTRSVGTSLTAGSNTFSLTAPEYSGYTCVGIIGVVFNYADRSAVNLTEFFVSGGTITLRANATKDMANLNIQVILLYCRNT